MNHLASAKITGGLKCLLPLSLDVTLNYKGAYFSSPSSDISLKATNASLPIPVASKVKPVLFSYANRLKTCSSFSDSQFRSSSSQLKLPLDDLHQSSTKLSHFLHQLNSVTCSKLQTPVDLRSSNSSISDPPAIWTVLAELNYSPSLFNLGVWYENKSQVLSTSNTKVRASYLSLAEKYYKRAVEVDEHPVAAYNLACRLLASNKGETKSKKRRYSVAHLMRIAASNGIEEAQQYLENVSTP